MAAHSLASDFVTPYEASSDASIYLPIKDWQEGDQPREKFMTWGREAVTDAELLGILLGTGTARESAVDLGRKLLALADNSLARLAALEYRQLKAIKGIGDAKGVTIAAALELGRRQAAEFPVERPVVFTAPQVYRCMAPMLTGLKKEQFWVLLLSNRCEVLRKVRISDGGIELVVADPRLVFREALLDLAASVILVHNHPSGSLIPSAQDDAITDKLAQAGTFLDIQVRDHIIFTDNGYYSYHDAHKL